METNITQLVAVTDTMRPWTAGMAGTETYDGRVPFEAAETFLSDRDVKSEPLNWARPAMPWDDPANVFTLNGQSFTLVSDESRQVIYTRDDAALHVPSEGYSIVQPSSLMTRASNIMGVSQNDLVILAVTQLDAHGAEFAVTVGTNEALTVDGVGAFVPCVVLGTSLNGTLRTYITGCSLQVVCYNTQAHALYEGESNGTLRKVKHTKHSAARLDAAEREVSEALGLITSQIEETTLAMSVLAETRVSDEQWSAFVSAMFPITESSTLHATTRNENSRSAVTRLYKSETLGSVGNAWSALQAVNTFDLWERGTRGDTNPFARSVRELITGKSATRETERADVLARVLATV